MVSNLAKKQEYDYTLPYNFVPRPYQFPFFRYMDDPKSKRKRAVMVEHRRAGKDLKAWNAMIKASQKRVGTYWHMLPQLNQARRVIWNGKDKDGRSFMSYIPEDLIASKRDDEMIIHLKNGSMIQLVGADKVDSLVGANPIWVTFSEFSIMKPSVWTYISPILRENEGTAVFIFTPRGRNHAFDIFISMSNDPNSFVQLLTVDDTTKPLIINGEHMKDGNGKKIYVPVVTKEDIDEERNINNIPEEIIQQEYYCSFDAGMVGAYYSEAMARIEKEDRIKTELYNPKHPVYTAWDLGFSDSMSIWYFQVYDNEVHVIEYNEFVGRSIVECCHIVNANFDALRKECNWEDHLISKAIAQFSHHRLYQYGEHFAPHDIKQTEISIGVTRLNVAKTQGKIAFKQIKRTDVQSGIDTVRKVLVKTNFDRDRCQLGIRALKEYRKEWDDKRQCYKDTPLHDWTSHPADCFRYLAQAVIKHIDKKFLTRQTTADHKYNPLDERRMNLIDRAEKKIKKNRMHTAQSEYNPLDLKNY